MLTNDQSITVIQSQVPRSCFADIEMFMMVFGALSIGCQQVHLSWPHTPRSERDVLRTNVTALNVVASFFSAHLICNPFLRMRCDVFYLFFFSSFVRCFCSLSRTTITIQLCERCIFLCDPLIGPNEEKQRRVCACVCGECKCAQIGVGLFWNVRSSHYEIAINTYSLPSTFVAHTHTLAPKKKT